MAMIDKSKLPPKTYNVQAQIDEATHKRLEAEAAQAGYLSIGTYLVSQVCGEPEWMKVARQIVFERMPSCGPNSIFFMSDLMTEDEAARLSHLSVGRAVRCIVQNTPDVCVREVPTKPGLRVQYQRTNAPAKWPGEATYGISELAVQADDELDGEMDLSEMEGSPEEQPESSVEPVREANAMEDPRDRKSSHRHMVSFWDQHRSKSK